MAHIDSAAVSEASVAADIAGLPRAGTRVVIVYDSGSAGDPATRGRTAEVARAVGRGVEAADRVVSHLIPVAEVSSSWSALSDADAIVFGCPTYMGSVSAAFKQFMEDSFPAWRQQAWKDKLAGVFTNSAARSGDKLSTLLQLTVFAAQHGMLLVSVGTLPGHITSTGTEEQPNRLGTFLGLMAQSNTDQGPAQAPPAVDRADAEAFGRRIADATLRWATPGAPDPLASGTVPAAR